MDYLLSMPQQKLETFGSDINPTMPYPQSDYYVSTPKNIEDFSVNIIQAWERMNANKTTGFRKDMLGIVALNNLVNSTALTALGGSDGVNTILQKNERLPCKTCGSTTAPYLQYMNDYIDDIKYFATKNIAGNDKVINRLKSDTKRILEAEAFLIRILNQEKIVPTELEAQLTGCQPDIIVGTKIMECKSWASRDGESADDEDYDAAFDKSKSMFYNFANGNAGYSQFKAYLSNVTTLSDLVYYFDGRKISSTEGDKELYVKGWFKKLLYNSASSALTTQGDEVWNIIVTKSSILQELQIVPNGSEKNQFISLIKNMDNKFYKFIYVK